MAAALQVRDIFHQPHTEQQRRSYYDAIADVLDRSGDHVTYIHLFDLMDHSGRKFSKDKCRNRFVNRTSLVCALDVRDQLARFLGRRFGGGGLRWFSAKRREIVGSCTYNPDKWSKAICRCMTTGYFTNAARLGAGGRYYSLHGN